MGKSILHNVSFGLACLIPLRGGLEIVVLLGSVVPCTLHVTLRLVSVAKFIVDCSVLTILVRKKRERASVFLLAHAADQRLSFMACFVWPSFTVR